MFADRYHCGSYNDICFDIIRYNPVNDLANLMLTIEFIYMYTVRAPKCLVVIIL